MTSFAQRHIGPDEPASQHMLKALGVGSIEELMSQALPPGLHADWPPDAMPRGGSEAEVLATLERHAAGNTVRTSLIGLGYYGTHTPEVLKRGILQDPSWYTAYTPYQSEISQGRLEALLNFQTVVIELTGLDIAGASMLDEATAAVEAMLVARRATKGDGSRFLIDTDLLPQTRAVLRTRAEPLGIELVEVAIAEDDPGDLDGVFGAIAQYPGASGNVPTAAQLRAWAQALHEGGAKFVVAADLLAMTMLVPPGQLGADIAVGSAQRFGVPMGFGGPHAGYLALRDELRRQLPGRLVGVSRDNTGAPALRLALQTREQHIRRERATSNICTAQVLLAVIAGMYAVWHGPDGLRGIAAAVHNRATQLAAALREAGVQVVHASFFDTLLLRLPGRGAALQQQAQDNDVLVFQVDNDHVSLAVDETTTDADLDRLLAALASVTEDQPVTMTAERRAEDGLAAAELREDDYLTHPTFHRYRNEQAMTRYLNRLADYDYALDRGMIPLGSCTMKLNAAAEMAPITWPSFANIHPFAPAKDVGGYLGLITELEEWLAAATGTAAVSLQPNAGSQGELGGLLAIRDYHRSRGDEQRNVCLVPSSAHGTNAASAVLAGMRVIIVACDERGDIDLADLRKRIAEHREELAAIMVTYPSTHGVYEPGIHEVCELVHEAGGQVYIDGANLNALLGYAAPGVFGGDVSHLNLHKTFAIPHGGGGPGVGPLAVADHLVPFLPGHPFDQRGTRAEGAISAAPHGSPGVLPISWAYIALMGAAGLKQATEVAVLSANYLAEQLDGNFPVLYRGDGGRVAHECVLDLRPMSEETGITVTDVAKRLMDYGFHAPTMSFPVPGTLMVEPTESEDLAELDRFCEAMSAIAAEVDKVRDGTWPATDNPVVGAPHTAISLAADWHHSYSREQAAFPTAAVRQWKYWPPVGRVEEAYGDRNLMCACPDPAAFES